jgi:cell division septal protein FtsQ
MYGDDTLFLPDRLRPQVARRRPRRGLALLSVVPVMLLALPQWRVEEVRVDGCSKLPPAAVRSLHELVGEPALDLDLESVRDRVQVWPGVGQVQVELKLPGTVIVRAEEEPAHGSVRIGRSWHGVAIDGGLTGVVEIQLLPILKDFETAVERGRALTVARRLQAASGLRVQSIQKVTPADYQVVLAGGEESNDKVIHIRPQGTVAELAWCAAVARGGVSQSWADLRWSDRMVVGSGG